MTTRPPGASAAYAFLKRGHASLGILLVQHVREQHHIVPATQVVGGVVTRPRPHPRAEAGLSALRQVVDFATQLGVPTGRIRVDPTLARGLDYYTGPVFEIVVDEPKIGSLAGGGRYDGLIGMFSGRSIPAVGISLGLERVLTVLEELGRLPASSTSAQAMVAIWDETLRPAAIAAARALREAGVRVDLFLGGGALKNQLKYANARGFRWLVLVGPSEAEAGVVALKDLVSGQQRLVNTTTAAQLILEASR